MMMWLMFELVKFDRFYKDVYDMLMGFENFNIGFVDKKKKDSKKKDSKKFKKLFDIINVG